MLIFDGLGYCERSVVVEEMIQVLAHVSQMAHDSTLRVMVKVLAVSPVPV